jgi:hypothetical protein
MPVAKFQQEAAECFRACRDTLLNLPLTVSEVAKSVMVRFVRGLGDETLQTLEQPLNEATLKILAQRRLRFKKRCFRPQSS